VLVSDGNSERTMRAKELMSLSLNSATFESSAGGAHRMQAYEASLGENIWKSKHRGLG